MILKMVFLLHFMMNKMQWIFYHQVARESNIPYINNQFHSNASDEQNHAVWFLYFMNHR
jgi:rubrerythrin